MVTESELPADNIPYVLRYIFYRDYLEKMSRHDYLLCLLREFSEIVNNSSFAKIFGRFVKELW